MTEDFCKTLTLKRTAARIREGMRPAPAIKEHVDAWNRHHSPELFQDEPGLLEDARLNAWLAGCAEYEAFLIGTPAPDWTEKPARFLEKPPGGHLKFPHPWPGQNPPPDSSGTRTIYAL